MTERRSAIRKWAALALNTAVLFASFLVTVAFLRQLPLLLQIIVSMLLGLWLLLWTLATLVMLRDAIGLTLKRDPQ